MKDTARFLGLYLCFSIILIAETTTNSRVFYNYTRDLDDAGSNAFNIKSHEFNIKSHEFSIKSHEFNISSHEFSIKSNEFNIKSNGFN